MGSVPMGWVTWPSAARVSQETNRHPPTSASRAPPSSMPASQGETARILARGAPFNTPPLTPLLALPSDSVSEGTLIGRKSVDLAVVVGGPPRRFGGSASAGHQHQPPHQR